MKYTVNPMQTLHAGPRVSRLLSASCLCSCLGCSGLTTHTLPSCMSWFIPGSPLGCDHCVLYFYSWSELYSMLFLLTQLSFKSIYVFHVELSFCLQSFSFCEPFFFLRVCLMLTFFNRNSEKLFCWHCY